MRQKSKHQLNKGFSLIELIVAISILVVLSGLLVPNFVNRPAEARLEACKSERNVIADAYRTELMTEEMTPAEQNYDDKKFEYYQYCLNQALTGTLGSGQAVAFDDAHAYQWKNTDANPTPCKSGGDFTFSVTQDGQLNISCSVHSADTIEVQGLAIIGSDTYVDNEKAAFTAADQKEKDPATILHPELELDPTTVKDNHFGVVITENSGSAVKLSSFLLLQKESKQLFAFKRSEDPSVATSLRWSTDNADVLDIDASSGEVEAKQSGSATVTVEMLVGDTAVAKDSCEVTVVYSIVDVRISENKVRLEYEFEEMKDLEETVYVAVETSKDGDPEWMEVTGDTVLPEGYSLKWVSTDDTVATAQRNIVSPHTRGEADIQIHVIHDNTDTGILSNILHVSVLGEFKIQLQVYKGRLANEVDDEAYKFYDHGNNTGTADDHTILLFDTKSIKDASNADIAIDDVNYKLRWEFHSHKMDGSLASSSAVAADTADVEESASYKGTEYSNDAEIVHRGIKVTARNAGEFTIQAVLENGKGRELGRSEVFTCTIQGRPESVKITQAQLRNGKYYLYGMFRSDERQDTVTYTATVYDHNQNIVKLSGMMGYYIRWNKPVITEPKIQLVGADKNGDFIGNNATVMYPYAGGSWDAVTGIDELLKVYVVDELDPENTNSRTSHQFKVLKNSSNNNVESEAHMLVQTYEMVPLAEITENNPVLAGDVLSFYTKVYKASEHGVTEVRSNGGIYRIDYSAVGYSTSQIGVEPVMYGSDQRLDGKYTFKTSTIHDTGDKTITLEGEVHRKNDKTGEMDVWGYGDFIINYVDEVKPTFAYQESGSTTYVDPGDTQTITIHVNDSVNIRKLLTRYQDHGRLDKSKLTTKGWTVSDSKAVTLPAGAQISTIADVQETDEAYTIKALSEGTFTLTRRIASPSGISEFEKEVTLTIKVVND